MAKKNSFETIYSVETGGFYSRIEVRDKEVVKTTHRDGDNWEVVFEDGEALIVRAHSDMLGVFTEKGNADYIAQWKTENEI